VGVRVSFGRVGKFLAIRHATSGFLAAGSGAGCRDGRGIFFFWGWWDVSKMARRNVRDPARTLASCHGVGRGDVAVVYILVRRCVFVFIPLDKVTSNDAFVAQAGEILFLAKLEALLWPAL